METAAVSDENKVGVPSRSLRLGIFVTHPIQYFAPLWRALAATPGLSPKVHFFSDHSLRGGVDPGFGVTVAWDVPLLEGYPHEFVSRDAGLAVPRSVRLPDARQRVTLDHFDAVMIHGYVYGFERDVVRAARANGVSTIIRGEFTDEVPYGGRGPMKRLLRTLYLRWFYGHVDAFCYVGEAARLHLVRAGVPASRMFFAPYSVDSSLFELQRQTFSRAETRAGLRISDDHLVLLLSGKLIPRKAPLLLTGALRHLRPLDKVVLLVVGDGELRPQIEAEGRALLGDRCRLLGFVNQSEIGRYYAAADVLVLPSRYETWGLVVNEAMQFGVPAVVSCKVGCHRDLIVEGRTGMVFADGDERTLAQCLERFLRDPALARRLGDAARLHVAAYSTEASAAGIKRALGLM